MLQSDACNFWTGIALQKKYDYARLVFDEIKELIDKKEKTNAKKQKEKYVPVQRFLQSFIAYTIENVEVGMLPDRSDEATYDLFDLKSFGPRKNETEFQGMDIPSRLLAAVRRTDPRAIAYKK